MEALHVLEQKISQLIDCVKQLRSENSELKDHANSLEDKNRELAKTIEAMELSLLSNKETVREEAELTKLAVDELIKSIDSLVDHEQNS